MRKIYGCLLVLLLGPAVLFVCICIFSNISFSECSKTWFCKDINMYVTIVHKHSGDDMIVLNNTDNTAYFRLCSSNIDENSIITVDQTIE